jgi:SET and MYND domain-containing protein
LSLIAARDIEKGEELTISYIDESASFIERQKQLMTYYKFVCDCKKCVQQL